MIFYGNTKFPGNFDTGAEYIYTTLFPCKKGGCMGSRLIGIGHNLLEAEKDTSSKASREIEAVLILHAAVMMNVHSSLLK